MTTVWVVRHAQSIHNATKGEDSPCDCGLSELGQEQAKSLEGNFDIVVCSPMARAKQTLLLSKIKYRKLIHCDAAREFMRSNGDFFPGEEQKVETEEECIERVQEVKVIMKELAQNGTRILLVAHHGTIQCMTKMKDDPGLSLKNAVITECTLR